MTISVIMSTYKEPLDYIQQAANSILRQSYRDIEFIIVIDAPERVDLIEMLTSMARNDSRVKIVQNEKNIGLTASLNRALDFSTGEIIARMDADDISHEDRLETQLNYLIENDLDIVGSNVLNIDESGNQIKPTQTNFPTSDYLIKECLKINNVIPHPTWLLKKTVFDKGRYIDFAYCEDYGFLLNAALNGFKMGNVKECTLKYRNNQNGISSTKRVKQKTGAYYLRQNYKRKKISTYNDYKTFLDSKDAQKEASRLARYYFKKESLKKSIQKKNYFLSAVKFTDLLLSSSQAKKVIRNKLTMSYLVKKYGKEY